MLGIGAFWTLVYLLMSNGVHGYSKNVTIEMHSKEIVMCGMDKKGVECFRTDGTARQLGHWLDSEWDRYCSPYCENGLNYTKESIN